MATFIKYTHENVTIEIVVPQGSDMQAEDIRSELETNFVALHSTGVIKTLPFFAGESNLVSLPGDEEQAEVIEKPAPEKKAPAKAAPKKAAEAIPEGPKVFTKAELQNVVKDALASGERQEVVAAFNNHGAAKLGEVKPEDYTSVAKELLAVIGGN